MAVFVILMTFCSLSASAMESNSESAASEYMYSEETVASINVSEAETYSAIVKDRIGRTATDKVVFEFVSNLELEASTVPNTVCIPPAPPADENCDCNGKMQDLTLLYNGPAGATVQAYDGGGGNAELINTFNNEKTTQEQMIKVN